MHEEKNYRLLKAALVLSFSVLFAAGSYAAEPERSSDGRTGQRILAEFEIVKGEEGVLLPVTYKGKDYLFLLDTGCSYTSFDTSFKRQLGKAKGRGTVLTSGGPMRGELFDAPEAFLGPFNMQECGQVTCCDLTMPSLVDGKKISGIIGMNFLRACVVQIDFDESKLLFLEPKSEPNLDWGKELDIKFHVSGVPQITGNILGGIKVDFFIDTGCNYSGVLDRKIFEEVVSKKQIRTCESLAATAAGIIQRREARISSLFVESFAYEDLIFDDGYLSCLGLSFLSRHIVTFDFPNSKVYFKKGKDFERVDETDMSGLHLLRILGRTVVYSVDEGSPAHKAGIRGSDIILKVGNKDASEYDMWELRWLLSSGDKKKVAMTIKCGDDAKEVSFLLKRKI